MGNKSSRLPRGIDPASPQPEELPQAYHDSYRLLSALVGDRNKRHLLARLQGDEAQSMADFMNRVLERETSQAHSERVKVLYSLSLLARLARVFPERLKLVGVECDFDPDQVHRGSQRDIYKGTFARGQAVCVKVIRGVTPGYTHEQLLKVHAKDAILSAHTIHPNVLPFYGVCDLSKEDSTRVCIVSPWMINGNLLQYIEKVSDSSRYLLMSDIISGLEYIHGLDIIHSDLQAANVLVSNEGRALLADFGTSRVSFATRTGVSSGGIYWTSPELFLGKIDVASRASDIWAYACTCFEILTGAQPFSQFTGNMPMLAKAFEENSAVPMHSALTAGKVDKRVLKKMNLCWEYDPSKRPTASDLCGFFRGLQLEDKRAVPDSPTSSRVTSDNTEINYNSVLDILQRVQKAPVPAGRKVRP